MRYMVIPTAKVTLTASFYSRRQSSKGNYLILTPTPMKQVLTEEETEAHSKVTRGAKDHTAIPWWNQD